MNQVLKSNVYGLGSIDEVRYLERIGGMNQEESKLYELFHDGCDDDVAQAEMSLDPKAFKRVETSMRMKFTIGVVSCVTFRKMMEK